MTTEHKRFPVAAAAIAGTLENFATFPFEYVKTQLQLQIRSSALYAGSSAYTGPLDVVQRTFRTAGLLGLYSGGASFVIFSPLRAVVRFTTFERLRITARSQQLRETPGGKRLSDLGCGVLAGAADVEFASSPRRACCAQRPSWQWGVCWPCGALCTDGSGVVVQCGGQARVRRARCGRARGAWHHSAHHWGLVLLTPH